MSAPKKKEFEPTVMQLPILLIVGFIIPWKIYNLFMSLEDAVHTSPFIYYVKKFSVSLIVSIFFAGYVGSWIGIVK